MAQIITNSMPIGMPGDLSRSHAIVESYNQNVALPVVGFGLPVKAGAGAPDTVTGFTTGDAATAIVGWLVRQNYSQSGQIPVTPEAFGVATPPVTGPCSVMKQGYMVVKLNGGAAVTKGSAVYVRVAAAAAGKPIGGVEGAADSTNTVLLTDCEFMGAADSEGNAEIRYRVGND